MAEQTAYHIFLFWLQISTLGFLHRILSLFDMRTVSMSGEISLVSFYIISILGHIPVDGINLVQNLLLVWTVWVFVEISLQGLFRTAYYGVGPVLIGLFQKFEVSHDGITMRLVSIFVSIKVTLQNHRVATLHRILVSFQFLILIGTIIEIVENATNEEGENQRDDDDATVAFFLFLGSLAVSAVLRIRLLWANRRNGWSRRCCCSDRCLRTSLLPESVLSESLLTADFFLSDCILSGCVSSFLLLSHRSLLAHSCRRRHSCERRIQLMAVRTHFQIAEINLATIWAFGNFACYFYSATRAGRCFIANLASAFRTFYNCHNSILCLLMYLYSSCFSTSRPYLLFTLKLIIKFQVQGSKYYRCLNLISLSLWRPMKRLLST